MCQKGRQKSREKRHRPQCYASPLGQALEHQVARATHMARPHGCGREAQVEEDGKHYQALHSYMSHDQFAAAAAA